LSFLVELPLETYADHLFDGFAPDADFRVGNARALMWMSQLAYEVRHAQHKVEPVLKRWGLRPVALVANTKASGLPLSSTRGIIATGHGATMMTFAGTDPVAFANWITNFNLGAPARDIHRGFDGAVDAVWDDVSAALTQVTDAQPLFIAGHSLGGALAMIAAERLLRERNIRASGVYTFGAPRVGTQAFADSYNASRLGDRSYRFVHGLDIVPTLPPSALGFRHAGRMVLCKRGGRFDGEQQSKCDCDDPPFFDTFRRGVQQRLFDLATGSFLPSSRGGWLGSWQKYVLPPPFTDHLPERYRRAFESEA
jgi:triacylglycerol lipase